MSGDEAPAGLPNAPRRLLAPGDRAPNFVLPDQDGVFTMFYERVQGRPTVLLFSGAFDEGAPSPAAAAFDAGADRLDAAGLDAFCVTLASPETVAGLSGGIRYWSDLKQKIADGFLTQLGRGGLAALDRGQVVALLLDANQRVLADMAGADAALFERALAFYAERPPQPPAEVRRATAPVLVMPGLLDRDMCRDLIEVFETGEVKEGSVASVLDGKQVSRIHHDRKKRLDHAIMDLDMNRVLQQVIGRRAAPELNKAFHFQGFKFDRFLVCRYAADREDRFRTHRDNLAPGAVDRRFAMTLNLNGDAYEGGELVFPEYGPDRYKPGDGGAVFFSCSLLHEALPVTRGVRYALLTFLRA